MNFVISLKQTKTKTAKQERVIDVHTLSNSLNETTKVVMLPAFQLLNLCNYQQIIKGLI